VRFVTPQYFRTLDVPLLRGRDVSESDTREQPFAVVVSDSLARRYWPNESPIGKRVKIADAERTIVGVVGDVRTRGLESRSEPQVYLPYRQVDDGAYVGYVPKELVVRTSGNAQSLVDPIRRIVQRADPEQPVSNVRTLSSIVDEETAPRVTQVRLLAALAVIALLIAAVGIHGLLTYSVARRLPELGVRRVLGAQEGEIVGLVVREGIVLAVIGIGIGVVVAYIAARGMGALLAGIRPGDPLTFVVASGLCLATVLAGSLRPALRAARVSPVTALRSE
jgi:predicted permease